MLHGKYVKTTNNQQPTTNNQQPTNFLAAFFFVNPSTANFPLFHLFLCFDTPSSQRLLFAYRKDFLYKSNAIGG
jgi:hypothetical protein